MDGLSVHGKYSLDYLGTTLDASGKIGGELSRRICMAKADMRSLCRIWSKSSVPAARRLDIYRALVEAKLLYSLACSCLNTSAARRLNGFQAKCLRMVLRIPAAFHSRISNAEVLRRAKQQLASEKLLNQQLQLFGKAARSTSQAPLRKCCFVGDSLRPLVSHFIRRVGRSTKEWVPTVLDEAIRRVGDFNKMASFIQDEKSWKPFCCTLVRLKLVLKRELALHAALPFFDDRASAL